MTWEVATVNGPGNFSPNVTHLVPADTVAGTALDFSLSVSDLLGNLDVDTDVVQVRN